MDELTRLVHKRLVLLHVQASSCLEEIRASGLSAHLMSVDGNPFPGADGWTRAPYPMPVIDVKGKGSIGFDPAGAFFVFAVPTTEAQPASIDALSDCFENTALLGAVSLRDYQLGRNRAVQSVAAAARDGEPALLVIVRFGLETEGLLRLFEQAALIMAGQLPTLLSPPELKRLDTSTT
ncbi:DUF3201 domain-containing protein [Candidatus Cryosericum septentrionale]|jgi:hypothetical protein|uniref:Uncharacterized protein n=1 Tax=Candidatus Cryosericum septentrionale TaxID=2290913 RepID=A0A398DV22_9BACT|nr:DUF3201 domain-containing protein [Candidatus Cryosericum septentrionale]RIE15948.1 hypothetical protein SMC1_09060 [Candidatus Cryosericum septentrionale]